MANPFREEMQRREQAAQADERGVDMSEQDQSSPIPNFLISQGKDIVNRAETGMSAGPNRFRQALEERRAAAEAPAESETNPGSFLNRGIATTLGAPVDLANAGLSAVGLGSDRPIGGSASIRSAMRSGGNMVDDALDTVGLGGNNQIVARPDQEAETYADSIAEGVGEATGALLPFGGMANVASKSASPLVSGIGKTTTQSVARRPGTALALEATGGAGAGAGRRAGQEEFPDNPAMQAVSELAGGVAGAGAPGAAVATAKRLPLISLGTKGLKAAFAPFTESGGRAVASRRMREMAEGSPEDVVAASQRETVADLDPVTKSGDEGLMALRNAVLEEDAKLRGQFRKRTGEAADMLRKALEETGEGVPTAEARDYFQDRQDALVGMLDVRVRQAADAARQRLGALQPRSKRSEASTVVRDEIEAALSDARKQERALWDQVPDDVELSTENSRAAFRRLMDDLPRAQQDDMPDVARRFLDEESNQRLGATETVKEVRGLRSKLLDEARKARSQGDFNSARVSEEIADALLEDMESAGDDASQVGQLLGQARNFSRVLNQTFKQGAVGRILGHAREGGARIPAEQTLQTTVGRGGETGAAQTRQLLRAVENPELPGNSARVAQTRRNVEDYLRSQFADQAAPNGTVDPQSARRFVQSNSEVLDQFPDLKRQMQDAEQAETLVRQIRDTAGQRADNLRAGRRTGIMADEARGRVLNSQVGAEIDALTKAKDPRAAAREVARQASKDQNGQAARGLKTGLVDYLMERTGGSGAKIKRLLDDRKVGPVADELLTQGERRRLGEIADELSAVDVAQNNRATADAVMDDAPSRLMDMVVRTFAARAGAQAGQGTSGASLLTAQFASQRAKKFLQGMTNNKARELIKSAVTDDPELFKALMLDLDQPRNRRIANQRLNAWLAGPGSDLVDDGERDQEARPDILTPRSQREQRP